MSSTTTCSSRFGIATFGVGRVGTIHFGNLVENVRVELLYVIDVDTEKANAMVSQRRLSETVRVLKPEESQQVFEDDRIHGIVIASPTFTHEELIRKGLKYGKAVFCEKPISKTTEGATECYKESELTGVPLCCSFNRRFDPSIVEMRQRVLNGEIGDVHVVRTCSRGNPNIEFVKTCGGMFYDSGIHDVDFACWLLQDFPVSVYAAASAIDKEYAAIGDVDTFAIVMKFANGAICTIDQGRHSTYGYDLRFEVLGSNGMLQCTNSPANCVVGYSSAGVTGARIQNSFQQRFHESFKVSLEHFLDVLEGKPLLVTGREYINVSKVLAACEESHRTGQAVTLTWD